MDKKLGRNDPCSCGSGKKFKTCCMNKMEPKVKVRQKITAKWINAPAAPDLMERTFGTAMESSRQFSAVQSLNKKQKPQEEMQNEGES